MAKYAVSIITTNNTFKSTVKSKAIQPDKYALALIAIGRIYQSEGIDLTPHIWDFKVKKIKKEKKA